MREGGREEFFRQKGYCVEKGPHLAVFIQFSSSWFGIWLNGRGEGWGVFGSTVYNKIRLLRQQMTLGPHLRENARDQDSLTSRHCLLVRTVSCASKVTPLGVPTNDIKTNWSGFSLEPYRYSDRETLSGCGLGSQQRQKLGYRVQG